MADDTEISTPVETSDVTTSTEAPEVSETADVEVAEEETQTAETETEETQAEEPAEEKLYAGKYKSIEELEKGYQEAQKTLTQNLQIKAKYDELLKKQEQQEALRLEKARELGYSNVKDAEIDRQVDLAEYNEFSNALRMVDPDYQAQVYQYLNNYFQTGDTSYLNEAKRYYPSDFLERVAVGKVEMKNKLKAQYDAEIRAKADKATAELAQTLKTDYAEFLSDAADNKGKAQALKSFCDANFIQSKEDMDVFVGIYKQIADYERAAAIKEYEAQKAIEETKQKATIQTDNVGVGLNADEEMPTADAMREDSSLYRKAVKKFGMEKVDKVLMKG